MRILTDQWKWQKGTIIFNVQHNKVVCTHEIVLIKQMELVDLMI